LNLNHTKPSPSVRVPCPGVRLSRPWPLDPTLFLPKNNWKNWDLIKLFLPKKSRFENEQKFWDEETQLSRIFFKQFLVQEKRNNFEDFFARANAIILYSFVTSKFPE
jgi:hypothetical protein